MSKSILHKNCDDLWECKRQIELAINELKENNPVRAFLYLNDMLSSLNRLQTSFREEALRQDKEKK